MFVTMGALLAGFFVAWIAVVWLYGVPPHVWLASLIYKDTPRLEVPARLTAAEPVAFQARILEKRNYWLNLRVYFNGDEQRAAVGSLVGGPVSQPDNAPHPAGKSTTFRVVVRDQENKIVHERSLQSNGRFDTRETSLGRRVDEFILDKGLYAISITPLDDISQIAAFRTSLELTYQPKSTAIQ